MPGLTNFVIQPRVTEAPKILSASFMYDSNFYTRTKNRAGVRVKMKYNTVFLDFPRQTK